VLLLLFRWRSGYVACGGTVDTEGVRGGWADGNDARTEFYADGNVVVGREAAFAKADCKLGELARWNGSRLEYTDTGFAAP
jgi:hypothetical protein